MRFIQLAVLCSGIGLLSSCSVPLEHFARPDASGDAPPAGCDPPGELCGGVCVDVAESSTDCGRCGHDCGGGACTAGRCQPVLVADAADQLVQPAGLAVNATAIFWTEQTRVRSCPLPEGCVADPRRIADAYSMLSSIAVTEDAVYFTGCRACYDHRDLWRCPVTGCPEPAPSVATTSLRYEEIIVAGSHAYWREATAALLECAHADCAGTVRSHASSLFGGDLISAVTDGDTLYVRSTSGELRMCDGATGCAPPKILPNSASIVPPFRVHDGMAYWLAASPPSWLVRRCAVANCGAGTTLATEDHPGTELEVDDTGVYWMSSSGELRHCPLTGCPPGGAVTLASGGLYPKELTLGAGFVYWIDGNTILEVAKP